MGVMIGVSSCPVGFGSPVGVGVRGRPHVFERVLEGNGPWSRGNRGCFSRESVSCEVAVPSTAPAAPSHVLSNRQPLGWGGPVSARGWGLHVREGWCGPASSLLTGPPGTGTGEGLSGAWSRLAP